MAAARSERIVIAANDSGFIAAEKGMEGRGGEKDGRGRGGRHRGTKQ